MKDNGNMVFYNEEWRNPYIDYDILAIIYLKDSATLLIFVLGLKLGLEIDDVSIREK